MKQKKYILLSLLFLITTGCSVEYNIEIDQDTIKELVQFTENINDNNSGISSTEELTYRSFIDTLYTIPKAVYIDANVNPYDEMQMVDGVEYYDKKMIASETEYGLIGTYNHSIERYAKAKTINQCYKNVSVLQNGDTLTLSTSRNNFCFEQYTNLDEISIRVKIDEELYSVSSHNADYVEKNEYRWDINKDNYNDKSVVIELQKRRSSKKAQNAMAILIGFIVVIIIGLLFIFSIARGKNRRKNEI